VTLYTRRGCHLCELAWQCLQAEQQRYHFRLETVDVDTDAESQARYGAWVPVVAVGGIVRFRGGVNRILLARLLRAEARRRPPTSGGQAEGAPDP
jgi:glutaredoxin